MSECCAEFILHIVDMNIKVSLGNIYGSYTKYLILVRPTLLINNLH